LASLLSLRKDVPTVLGQEPTEKPFPSSPRNEILMDEDFKTKQNNNADVAGLGVVELMAQQCVLDEEDPGPLGSVSGGVP
jgi:hypothetical protein